MRALLAVVLAAGLLWGGYWFVGAHVLDSKVNAWFDAKAAAGQDIGRDAVTIAGFPNRFDVTVTAPHARDAALGWGWSAPFVQVFSMTWKPWHLIAALPDSQQITTPDGQQVTLNAKGLRASLLLRPGLDLALDQAVVEGSALALVSSRGWRIDSARAVLAAGADRSWKNGLRLGVEVADLKPDAGALGLVADLGPTIAALHLDATAELTAPVDRHLGETQVGVTALHLADAHLTWGPLVLAAKGAVSRGADGLAAGQLDLTVDHWQRLPDALEALGVLPAPAKALVSRALTLLAQGQTNPDRIEVPLVMKDGRMVLGGLPLGPAPRLP